MPKQQNIVSVILGFHSFHSTDMHVKKSLTHTLWNMEGSGVPIGSCQTLWPTADLSLGTQTVYNPRYDICGWMIMTGKSTLLLLFYIFHWMSRVSIASTIIRRHKVTLYWKFLKSWKNIINTDIQLKCTWIFFCSLYSILNSD